MYISTEKHWSDHPRPFLYALSTCPAGCCLVSSQCGVCTPWGCLFHCGTAQTVGSPSLVCAEGCPLAVILLCVIQSAIQQTFPHILVLGTCPDQVLSLNSSQPAGGRERETHRESWVIVEQ